MRKINIVLLILTAFFVSCIEESEDLVNPPSKAETVKVRFVNLAGDKEPRSMVYESMYETESIAYGDASAAVHPPADSSILEVKKGNMVEFKQYNIVKYIRNSVYTFIALPSLDTATVQNAVDTIISFRTTAAVDRFSTNAYVKFFNGVNDPNISFSLKIGCPNGEPVKNYARYNERMVQPIAVRSGIIAFSLIINTPEPQIIDLYEVELSPRAQYLFIAMEDAAGNYNLLIVEEENAEKEGVYYARIVEERNTFVRAINFTDKNIDIARKGEENLFESLQPEYVTNYNEIEVCKGADKDTIDTYISNALVAQNSISLDVLEKYTIFTFDGEEPDTYFNMISEPVRLDKDISGKAMIRTVNGANAHPGLTVSVGARTDISETGFSSGENLATRLLFSEMSIPQIIEPGILPIVVFTSTQPAYLLYSTKIEVEPDKSYFIVLSNSNTDNINVSLFETDDTEQIVAYKELGVFSQVVNALYDKDSMFVEINPPMLDHARLGASGSLATVLDEGLQEITLNSNTVSVNTVKNKRVLVIAYGSADNPDTYVINSSPMGATSRNFMWRFVNVSNIEVVGVKESLDSESNLVNVLRNSETPPEAIDRERKRTFYFINEENGEELYRLNDVQLNFGKNYTIIFTGDTPESYNTIIQQEF